jgi:hypothetical protein
MLQSYPLVVSATRFGAVYVYSFQTLIQYPALRGGFSKKKSLKKPLKASVQNIAILQHM